MDIFLPETRTSYLPEKGTFKIPLDRRGDNFQIEVDIIYLISVILNDRRC
jgi:hypothetical protein